MKTIQDYLNYPWVKGSFLGAGVMFLATPGINCVVSQAMGKPMPWSRPFTGCYSLSGAGAAGNAVTFAIKALLGGEGKDVSEGKRFWTASIAGAVSGMVLCPFESAAQTQLTTKTPLTNTVSRIYNNHGVAGFFRSTCTQI